MLSVAYFSATIGVITTLVFVYVSNKLFNLKTALTTGLITALMPQQVSWNVMYLPIITIIIFLLCRKIIEKKYKMIIWMGLLIGIGLHIHFTVAILLLLVLTSIILSKPEKNDYKKILHYALLASVIVLLFISPLIIFDMTHNLMNTQLFLNFFTSSTNSGFKLNIFESLRVFLNSFDLLNIFKSTYYSAIISMVLFTAAVLTSYIFDRKKFVFTIIWLLLPLIIFSLYNGNITEYYFSTTASVIILYLGLLSSKLKKTYIPLLSLALFLAIYQANTIIQFKDPFSLNNQKKIVHFLNTQQKDQKFNLSYDIAAGQNAAFPYLFRREHKQPSNTDDSHLYTVINMPTNEKYENLEVFGGFGLVRR